MLRNIIGFHQISEMIYIIPLSLEVFFWNYKSDDFGKYIGQVFKAIEHYNFERYGYKYTASIASTLNLGAEPEIGAMLFFVECIKWPLRKKVWIKMFVYRTPAFSNNIESGGSGEKGLYNMTFM